MSWFSWLRNLFNSDKVQKSGLRVELTAAGSTGPDTPLDDEEFVVRVRNLSDQSTSIVEAGVAVRSDQGDVWKFPGQNAGEKSSLGVGDSADWTVDSSIVRSRIAGEGIYDARLSGFAQSAKGVEAQSRSVAINTPYRLG